ncbi:3-deoxy-7-phosphoheptulonate synthase [Luminiphilus sp.]|nr:3-deoxy-7-phosphoheptulonate synthase [Luminiphilus sp.]
MSKSTVHNVNVASQEALIAPTVLRSSVPVDDTTFEFVTQSREVISDILDRKDPRLVVVVGPCSIHDCAAALAYAKKLKALSERVKDTLYIVMRVYFEKPRTTTGWKGLINDPHLDDSFDIEAGLKIGRTLLRDLLQMGLPTATEALDPITPQYLQDLISWSAIGARTTESQTHREMASGLSSAVGFKNGTDGSLDVAINALKSVQHPHRFLGINSEGVVSVFETRGNSYGHVVLRGGSSGPNYQSAQIDRCERALAKAGLPENIMVDCSHANSSKDHNKQSLVTQDVCHQILKGNRSIIGLMLESHINEGRQDIPMDLSNLAYGVSVTDACMSWETTETTLIELADALRDKLPARV